MASGILRLSNRCIKFEPVNKTSDIFYDNVNKKIFTTNHNGGSTVVTARGPQPEDVSTFNLNQKGSIFSIKLSPDLKIVAVQRSPTTVEFTNVNAETYNIVEYAQSCKGKNTQIVGIEWTCSTEILFITDCGLELYQVIPDKQNVRSIRVQNISVNWYVYSPVHQILIVSSGAQGTILQPYIIQPGSLVKSVKFEVDLGLNPKMRELALLDRDVCIVSLYGYVYNLVLRHVPKGCNTRGTEVWLYKLNTGSGSFPVKKTHILRVGAEGRFAVHVVDDLIVVHQQQSKTSLLFDVHDSKSFPFNGDATQIVDRPVFTHSSIAAAADDPANDPVVLYAPTWVVFQPDVIIDARVGFMWCVDIDLAKCTKSFSSNPTCIKFLLRRQNAKSLILDTLFSYLNEKRLTLSDATEIWNLVSSSCGQVQQWSDSKQKTSPNKNVIGQSELYTHVLFPASENHKIDIKWFADILIEYFLSLQTAEIVVQPFVQELLVTSLIRSNQFHKLDQLVRYNVITDSKPMAFLLLSLESQYPPALQLSIDLLSKKNSAVEEITEILLSKQKVLEALRYVQSHGVADKIPPMKFVEAAFKTDDRHTFYTIFAYFEQLSFRKAGTFHFAKGTQYDEYLAEYRKILNAS